MIPEKTLLQQCEEYIEKNPNHSNLDLFCAGHQLAMSSIAPPAPVGIDVEALAKEKYPNIMINECTGPIDFDKRNVAQKELRKAFKAGYSASLPQSSTEEEKDDDYGWIYCPNCGRVKAEQ